MLFYAIALMKQHNAYILFNSAFFVHVQDGRQELNWIPYYGRLLFATITSVILGRFKFW